MIYPLVREMAAPGARVRVPVAVTCRVLGFSEQAYYRWLKQPVSAREAEEQHLIGVLRELHEDDLEVLGYWEWRDNLERGVAAHHAGLLPTFKEVVEELFRRKLVKVVFATETLALGINMPARTVVLEKLEKFNGEARVAITSGEYTQLTGRAGRRGIDVEGHAVVQWTESLDPQAVAALASRRTYPLNSSFRPTYNMAVNLIDQFGRQRAREILESSFAQFQADRAVVGLAREVKDAEESLAGYAKAMACDRGDFVEYAGLRRELSDLEKLNRADRTAPARIRDQRQREIQDLRRRLQRHPCHTCPDREAHARWGERYAKLQRRVEKIRRQIDARTGTVARVFDRVVDVLVAVDYVHLEDGGEATLTPAGATISPPSASTSWCTPPSTAIVGTPICSASSSRQGHTASGSAATRAMAPASSAARSSASRYPRMCTRGASSPAARAASAIAAADPSGASSTKATASAATAASNAGRSVAAVPVETR